MCVLLCMLGMETVRPCFNVRWQIPLQVAVFSKAGGISSCKLETMGNSDLAVTAHDLCPYLPFSLSVCLSSIISSTCVYLFVHHSSFSP